MFWTLIGVENSIMTIRRSIASIGIRSETMSWKWRSVLFICFNLGKDKKPIHLIVGSDPRPESVITVDVNEFEPSVNGFPNYKNNRWKNFIQFSLSFDRFSLKISNSTQFRYKFWLLVTFHEKLFSNGLTFWMEYRFQFNSFITLWILSFEFNEILMRTRLNGFEFICSATNGLFRFSCRQLLSDFD